MWESVRQLTGACVLGSEQDTMTVAERATGSYGHSKSP